MAYTSMNVRIPSKNVEIKDLFGLQEVSYSSFDLHPSGAISTSDMLLKLDNGLNYALSCSLIRKVN